MTTFVLAGSSLFLFMLSYSETYTMSLTLMSLALACCGFQNSGVLLNPQDIAPNHGGQVFGFMTTIGTIPGFVGVYLAGFILEQTHKWSYVFNFTAVCNLIGWLVFCAYGKAEAIV